MTDPTIQRDLGSLSAQIESLNREMRDIKADVKQLRDDFAQVRGGGRALMGIAALLGGAMTWLLTQLFGRP
jgi:hypothetical protein